MSDDPPSPGATLQVGDGDPSTQAAVEGAEVGDDPTGSSSTVREMLLATDPQTPLEEVEAPYDPERGGLARIYRGVQKATGIEGMPAIVDIVVGGIEAMRSFDLEGDGDGDDQNDGDDQDAGPLAGEGAV